MDRKLLATFALFATLALAFAAPADAAPLLQLPGKMGCVSFGGKSGCAPGRMTAGTEAPLAISPDGKSAYLLGAHVEHRPAESVDVFDRDPTDGAITQKPGAAGCISGSGAAGCAKDGRLNGLRDAVVSPDDKDVYVTTFTSVVGFARDPETGALSPIPGPSGCIASPRHRAVCQAGVGLESAFHLAISPDGKELYVTNTLTPTVAILRRDPTTGALSQATGAAGCVTAATRNLPCDSRALPRLATTSIAAAPDGQSVDAVTVSEFGATSLQIFRREAEGTLVHPGGRRGCFAGVGRDCRPGRALGTIEDLALSPKGNFLYVAWSGENVGGGIAVLRRGPGGALSQAGCVVSERPARGCRVVPLLARPTWIAVSPDGAEVYASTAFGLEVLRRSPSGALSELPGAAGCFVDNLPTCHEGRGLDFPAGITISPDGANVYVTNLAPGGVAIFSRSAPGVAQP